MNGNAEAGPAGTGLTNIVTSVPGWAITGNANVLSYNINGLIGLTNSAPPDHGFQYFAAGAATSTLSQDIDVSSAASAINANTVKVTAAAYLGSVVKTDSNGTAQMAVAFKNSSGQTFSTLTLGPLGTFSYPPSLSLQQKTALVPSGTIRITLTLTLTTSDGAYGGADSVSLVLNTLGTNPSTVIGTNLITNGNAEVGSGVPLPAIAANIPGWSTNELASVTPYGAAQGIQPTDPGPPDRGTNLFCGASSVATMYQDVDVSPASTLIDAGQVTYQISAWLGAYLSNGSPTLTYTFFDWSGKQLAATAQLGPASHTGTSLVETSKSGALPAGVRTVHILVSFPTSDAFADDIAFTLAAPNGPPVISPGGIVSASAFGGFTAISPGSWIEIYGSDLAAGPGFWSFTNGVANSVTGVSVSVGGKAAIVEYVTPGQIDALVSSDAPTGAQPITVTNANGTSDKFWLIVNPTAPGLLAPASFVIGGKQYLAALFSDGQTFALPVNAIPGVPSRPAKAGDTLTIYGVGFGPVSGGFTAGTLVTQQNSLSTPIQFNFGNIAVTPTYGGLAPSLTGLYQFNVVVPAIVAANALSITYTLGGAKGTQA